LDIKEWFITTPAVILLDNSIVRNSWEEKVPDLNAVIQKYSRRQEIISVVNNK